MEIYYADDIARVSLTETNQSMYDKSNDDELITFPWDNSLMSN